MYNIYFFLTIILFFPKDGASIACPNYYHLGDNYGTSHLIITTPVDNCQTGCAVAVTLNKSFYNAYIFCIEPGDCSSTKEYSKKMKLSEYKTRYLKEKILPEKLMSNHGEQEYTFGITCCDGSNCSKGYTANNIYLNMVANSYSDNMSLYLPKSGEGPIDYLTRIGEMEKNMSNESPKYGKSPINISSGFLGFMIYILLK